MSDTVYKKMRAKINSRAVWQLNPSALLTDFRFVRKSVCSTCLFIYTHHLHPSSLAFSLKPLLQSQHSLSLSSFKPVSLFKSLSETLNSIVGSVSPTRFTPGGSIWCFLRSLNLWQMFREIDPASEAASSSSSPAGCKGVHRRRCR